MKGGIRYPKRGCFQISLNLKRRYRVSGEVDVEEQRHGGGTRNEGRRLRRAANLGTGLRRQWCPWAHELRMAPHGSAPPKGKFADVRRGCVLLLLHSSAESRAALLRLHVSPFRLSQTVCPG